KISREEQDEFAILSYRRALEAQKEKRFTAEIAPVEISVKGETTIVDQDEEPGKVKFEKISSLKPAFKKDGTITAANASKLNDGAAALVLMDGEEARRRGLKPLARIHKCGGFAQSPEWFTTAPAPAIRQAVERTIKEDGKALTLEEIDLFEINEAFAVVALANIKLLGIPIEKVNVNGGAVALGHPIGASGARILTTLIYALHQRNLRWGVAAICLGGGEGIAMTVERL
ncbi:MAG: thiolase family protein, partial [bacterium]